MNNSLMAIGAHVDDLELNIGGTLAKYHECGYEIVYVMSTDNISGLWSHRMPDGSIESTLPPIMVDLYQIEGCDEVFRMDGTKVPRDELTHLERSNAFVTVRSYLSHDEVP